MSDHLRELQRQRALAQEQVAWFDREIAKETNQMSAAVPPAAVSATIKPLASAAIDHTADEILAQYQQNPLATEKDVKKGCYLYFACALGAVVLFALGVYLFYAREQ